MGFAISLTAKNESAIKLYSLWDALAAYESEPSMRALGYPPHITLAIYEPGRIDEEAVRAAFRRATENEPVVRIAFDRLRIFEGEPLVVWAAPRRCEALQRMHRTIHAMIDPVRCHRHYRPSGWTPHCTLATNIRRDCEAEARAYVERFDDLIVADFDVADCISFQPIQIVETRRLPRRPASPPTAG